MKYLLAPLLLIQFSHTSIAQEKASIQDSIQTYFREIKDATAKGKSLWNMDLYGPMLLVNPETRDVFSNYPDSANILSPCKNIYCGHLPTTINIANTSVNWNGRRWAMIKLPLPADKFERLNLLAHELFHKAQPTLGFPLSNTDNNHLDKKEGRIYLRLELEALLKALNAPGTATTRQNIKDALAFRKYRYSLYPGADSTENAIELNEGLAEYSGFVLSGRNKEESKTHFETSIRNFLSNPTFIRSFPYELVPVYGYLLQSSDKHWNKKVTMKTRLLDFFTESFRLTEDNHSNNSVKDLLPGYNGNAIIDEENRREVKNNELIAACKHKFIEQPHFDLSFEAMSISFEYKNLLPLDNYGTVYPVIRVTDKWGILDVKNGALMSPNWDKITVSQPNSYDQKEITGDGWTLTLNDGYKIVREETNGNYRMVKK